MTLVLLAMSQLYGQIIETAHFSEMVPHINKETLVIIDIDDTLLIPVQMLGCDVWFEGRMKGYLAAGCMSSEALEKSLNEWQGIRHLSQMEIVEKGNDQVVADLQKKGFCVMGLTTQGLALASCTTQQLKSNNIDLSPTAPSQDAFSFPIQDQLVLFRKGILFTAGTSKGDSLFTLCDKIGYKPKRIVFINDKATHLRDIEAVAEKKGVEFIGLRYAFSDSRKKAFSPEIADYQFRNSSFAHILTDEEAKAALAAKSKG